jgi:hypothetical protein
VIRRGAWLAIIGILYGFGLFGQNKSADTLGVAIPEDVVVLADSLLSVSVANDTLPKHSRKTKTKPKFYPNPKRALRLSLLTPGLGGGQLYNRDYWKLPIVLGSYGASFYFVFLNIDRYGTMVDHYKEFYHLSDPNDENYGLRNNDVNTVLVYIKSENRYREMSIDQVKRAKDTYRRWRDWSFFALGAVYALAAIEANVAAHMKTFDLSDDISMRVQPSVVQPNTTGLTPGVKLVFVLK